MEKILKLLFVVLVLCISLAVYGVATPKNIEDAISKIDYGFIDFKYTMKDDQLLNGKKDLWISEFQPGSDILYNLKTKDGKEPSKRERRRYSKDKVNLFGKDRFVEDTEFTFTDLVKSSEYYFIKNERGISHYSFRNQNSIIPQNDEPLYGEVWLNDSTNEITRVMLKNYNDLDVFIGISIKKFQLNFYFEPLDKETTIIKDILCEIYGNILFFNVDYSSTISMSNYRSIN